MGTGGEDILHAYRNAVDEFVLDDMTMLIGPSSDAILIEVGVVAARDYEGFVIVHAMKARDKFLR